MPPSKEVFLCCAKYSENYKTQIKEIEGKNQYCQNDYTTQGNLQISIKLPMTPFEDLEQKILKFV